MPIRADAILRILDKCCDDFQFPMLDNGYVYLAATRLSLYRSTEDWGLVIEIFGFSPRSGLPDTCIHTFASRLHDRDPPEKYVSRDAYEKYLTNNLHNESRFVYPIEEGDAFADELVAPEAREILVRGKAWKLPARDAYAQHGIELEDAAQVNVFELCRYLADAARDDVLATEAERRISIRSDMLQLLQLEEWHHPNVVDESARPSGSMSFQQLARALETGDISAYRPTEKPNTHWRNWPDGGTL